ncbi:hypothetical protein FHR75_003934 [Kineococcus radiotolerans]|uniref:Uncharacterized protein n=1 Tax=Kineococcus radiotolerans TaxID=131568 RepID=A0A7W4XZ04_KINRA|nr:hypothetical protein [Kineococcus radiotolerans]MBB2903092.1 hypothetical protein [Kineococcus radiotolerans]
MPRTTNRGSRINARRATTVGLTSFATLTLIPLLAPAKPTERALLLLAAVPAAALFGYLAGYAAGSATHLDAAQQDIQLRTAHLQTAHRSASTTAPPGAPGIRLISEPIPPSGTGSPLGSGHLAGLARPPADPHPLQHGQQHEQRYGPHVMPAPSRGASTTAADDAAEAPTSELDHSSPHLTLIVTQHPAS